MQTVTNMTSTSNVIEMNPKSVEERYTEKRFESTANMICVNVHLWSREKQQLNTRPGQITEFWVKNGVRMCEVDKYRPQHNDTQLYPLIAAFDLLGTNRQALEIVEKADGDLLRSIETPPNDPNMKVRWIVMEACRLIMMKQAQAASRAKYPAPNTVLPMPAMVQ